jgi:aryl-alcohol dehydrogenase-like predicted oxidoreductase
MDSKSVLKRNCGTTDLKLSEITLGGWSFGGGSYWGDQAQSDIEKVILKGVELGINSIDTAEAYDNGSSETEIGRVFQSNSKTLDRKQIVIGTKVPPQKCAPQILRHHLEESLKRLNTDYVDIYMIHWPVDTIDKTGMKENEIPNVKTTFETLMALQKEGLIRHIGVSNFGIIQLKEALSTGVTIAVNQVNYSILTRAIEFEVLPFCKSHGIGVVVYMCLLQGILTGKYTSLDTIPENRLRTRHFSGTRPQSRHGGPGFETEFNLALAKINEIAARENVPMIELALTWCLKNDAVTSIVVGCRNEEQLVQNISFATKGNVMSQNVYEELCQISDDLKNKMGSDIDLFQSKENSRSK